MVLCRRPSGVLDLYCLMSYIRYFFSKSRFVTLNIQQIDRNNDESLNGEIKIYFICYFLRKFQSKCLQQNRTRNRHLDFNFSGNNDNNKTSYFLKLVNEDILFWIFLHISLSFISGLKCTISPFCRHLSTFLGYCRLGDDIYQYHFCSQGKTKVDSIDDKEEMQFTDVSKP